MMEEELEVIDGGVPTHRSGAKDKNAIIIKSKKKAEMIKKNEDKKERDTIAMKIRRNINIKVAQQILGYNNKKVSTNKVVLQNEEFTPKMIEEKKPRKIPGVRYEDEEEN